MQEPMIRNGIYPTMITPYTRKNHLDEEAILNLVRWYQRKGCQGIFAACQSSEIFQLTLKERKRIVELTSKEAIEIAQKEGKQPMTVVASGHVSDEIEAQAEELNMMWEAGAQAVVLISNRLDIANTGESAWIKEMELLLNRLPADMPLGIYECPTPYKRLLSHKMLQELSATGRFFFFKDTCCDPVLLQERLEILKEGSLRLFNANAQTLLASLQYGGSGYCGVMANFHPQLYVWLYEHFRTKPKEAQRLENVLSMIAFSETLAYPVTAKYYLDVFEKIAMEKLSRSKSEELFGTYDQLCMKQLKQLTVDIEQGLKRQEEKYSETVEALEL